MSEPEKGINDLRLTGPTAEAVMEAAHRLVQRHRDGDRFPELMALGHREEIVIAPERAGV